jgi:NAD(P)-dependent dehydrogenase (short-subunit alcohol dehydrogenase family)
MNLQDKVCLVTGGTRGIGAATAIALAERGAHLAVAARHLNDEARQTAARIADLGRQCALISADFGYAQDAARCVEETRRQLGPVSVLVHAAGGAVSGGLLELTPAAWHSAFAVHVHAVFHLCQAVVPMMKPRKEGALVLISSVAGLRGLKFNLAYQAAKGALPQLTRALAYELADDNIRVNCVAPGIIRTAFHAAMPPEVKQFNLDKRIPLHREGAPDQVAALIAELVTNDYVTGETFTIDGGLTMRIA